MTVAELTARLQDAPRDAVVLMDNGGGLSRVAELSAFEPAIAGEPPAVLLSPSLDE